MGSCGCAGSQRRIVLRTGCLSTYMPYMHVRASTAPTEDIPQTSLYLYGMDMYTCMQVYVDHVGRALHDRRTHKQTKSYHTYICISNYRYVRTYVCMCVSAHIVKITRYLFPRDFANTLLAQDTLCCAVRKAPLNLQGLLCASVE